jgi:serine/threonine-protein kinase
VTEIPVGTEIGGYRVVGLIGHGGIGTVYLADETATGARAALKVLLPELATQDAFRRRFLRESRYARSVDHPGVVRVRDAGEADGLLYIAMDYVAGRDLHTLLSLEGPVGAERALRILTQVALALDAVHSAGIIHRDVKPANVIVTGSDEAEYGVLTDFGLGKSPSQDSRALTGPREFVGTYYYTAPEQILGLDPDSRADVYSLGCVLYQCLAGEPPFPHELATDVLQAHIDEPPPPVTSQAPGLPRTLDAVLATALAKQPASRFASCAELVAAAREAVSPAPVAVEEARGEPAAAGPAPPAPARAEDAPPVAAEAARAEPARAEDAPPAAPAGSRAPALHLEIDLASPAAEIGHGDAAARLVLEDGAWRLVRRA